MTRPIACPACKKVRPQFCEECFECLQAQIAWSDRKMVELTDELVKAKEAQRGEDNDGAHD